MKKKILLALPNFAWRPAIDRLMWHYFPYGLCMIAAVLEKNPDYDVSIIDAYKENLTREEFGARVAAARPDVVGLTVLTDYFGVTMHEAAGIVREAVPSATIIVGGVYVTTNIERVLGDANIDYAITGEGELTVPVLLEHVFNGAPITADGIYYADAGGTIHGQGRSPLIDDLDSLPRPAYHLIDFKGVSTTVSRASHESPGRLPYVEMLTSRGCPYNCAFCQSKYIGGRRFRTRSVANVFAEIDWLVGEYGIKSVVFLDDNFIVDKQRAIAIMRGMAERGLDWKLQNTAVYLLDDELLEAMAECGCKEICLPMESGVERVLHEVMNKPIKSLDFARRIAKKAKEVGMYVVANFVVGFPSETWDEIRQTLRFAEEVDVDYVRVFPAVPLLHTELYEQCRRGGFLVEGFDPYNINWNSGQIETPEFTANDMTILRAYEWDRINFGTPEKCAKTAAILNLTEAELARMRRSVRKDMLKLLRR